MSGSGSIPSQPPNYSSSSSSLPKGPVPTPTNGPEAMKLQLNIQSLSLDCSIPLGSNLGLQVAVPPAPGTAPQQQHQNNPPTSTSQPVPSTSTNQPQSSSSPSSAPAFGPESILLGLANSFIQRLERVERDLTEERRVNVNYRNTIQRLEERLNQLENNMKDGENHNQNSNGTGNGDVRNGIPQNREYVLDPPSQISIPTSLPTRTTPQRYTATQEIEPDAIDERDTWTSPQPHPYQGVPTGEEEEEEEMDDPTGLGLDDDQAILYGFKPRNKE
ncbi:hypothetical protein I203_105159 [Kwoniella mangroviensis CBS 8507]|uniref:uncharacterized protein n=1 Tax=Kwoniella mangroviensis CBS 8507 TaxID=1296122 RepID=UPI00080D5559|nr:uncharacterized protein I203_00980 [Kwoniella mangroviensis CBS 8507]OCF69127.1 hypothetical protein I203_00980 [Kwoniella mangroviensis CBS 8507]